MPAAWPDYKNEDFVRHYKAGMPVGALRELYGFQNPHNRAKQLRALGYPIPPRGGVRAKLTRDQVEAVYSSRDCSQRATAEKFGVSQAQVSRIQNKLRWRI